MEKEVDRLIARAAALREQEAGIKAQLAAIAVELEGLIGTDRVDWEGRSVSVQRRGTWKVDLDLMERMEPEVFRRVTKVTCDNEALRTLINENAAPLHEAYVHVSKGAPYIAMRKNNYKVVDNHG